MRSILPVLRRVRRVLHPIALAALRDRRGATAIEYGLILAFMVIAMIVGLSALGSSTSGMWNNVSAKVEAAR